MKSDGVTASALVAIPWDVWELEWLDNPMLTTVYSRRVLDPPGEAISNIMPEKRQFISLYCE